MVLALVPVILFAFWPGYFGHLRSASVAFHAHGLTASAWLLLIAAQSWTAHSRNMRVHRGAGRALFVVVPLFAGAAVLAAHSMAIKFATRSDPFYAVLGARLGAHDILSTIALVALVCAALIHRRQAALHAGYMLATALLVLPPIVARLPLPRIFHLGEIVAIILALALAWWEPRGRRPLFVVAFVQVMQIAQFETFGASAAWASAFARFGELPVLPLAAAASGAALTALWFAWGIRWRPVLRSAVA